MQTQHFGIETNCRVEIVGLDGDMEEIGNTRHLFPPSRGDSARRQSTAPVTPAPNHRMDRSTICSPFKYMISVGGVSRFAGRAECGLPFPQRACKHSARNLPLNDWIKALSVGLPGREK
jgi:hypothetical protein